MKKFLYVYNYYPQYEESMALLEFERFFHAPYEKYHFTDIDIAYDRSVFIKVKLTLFHEASSVEELIALLAKDHLYYEDFKVVYYKNDLTHYDYRTSLREASAISEVIDGTTSLTDPKLEFAFTYISGTYYFGLLERNKDWDRYEVKPYSYSHSLPLKVARCALNLGVGSQLKGSVIDPACGVGTVVLEGLGMGLDIVGSDINRYVSYKGRQNIAHFGFDPMRITKKDIHDITAHYDVCILDVPYGVYAPFTIEEQIDLIREAYRIADRLVVITHVLLNEAIAHIGFTITAQCTYTKGQFTRYISLCEKEA